MYLTQVVFGTLVQLLGHKDIKCLTVHIETELSLPLVHSHLVYRQSAHLEEETVLALHDWYLQVAVSHQESQAHVRLICLFGLVLRHIDMCLRRSSRAPW